MEMWSSHPWSLKALSFDPAHSKEEGNTTVSKNYDKSNTDMQSKRAAHLLPNNLFIITDMCA